MTPARAVLQPVEVLQVVADHYGVTRRDLYHTRAREPIRSARRVALSLIHELCGVSWETAAAVMGISGGGTVQDTAEQADPATVAHCRALLLPALELEAGQL